MSKTQEIPHGTTTGYAYHHCRCARCREAQRVYMADYRARKSLGQVRGYRTASSSSVEAPRDFEAVIRAGLVELQDVFATPIPKKDLCAHIGITPSQLDSEIATLEDQGIVTTPDEDHVIYHRNRT